MESVVEVARTASDMAATGRAVAHGALMGARGISGVVLSQVLRGFCERVGTRTAVDAPVLADALVAASGAADAAVSRPVEGTMLTVIRAAAEKASAAAEAGGTLADVLEAAVSAAVATEARTPELLLTLRSAGVEDAGGAGVVLFLKALLHVVSGAPQRRWRCLAETDCGLAISTPRPPARPSTWRWDSAIRGTCASPTSSARCSMNRGRFPNPRTKTSDARWWQSALATACASCSAPSAPTSSRVGGR
jgi:hypothetical protein